MPRKYLFTETEIDILNTFQLLRVLPHFFYQKIGLAHRT